jgi:hypothetical protein
MATGADIVKLKSRMWEADLVDWRGYRILKNQDWHNRLKNVDRLARGDWAEYQSDESVRRENPHVMNLVQVGMADKAKLCSESVPTIVCAPEQETTTSAQAAHKREAVFDTHWEMNHGDILIPMLSMDLDGAGAAFVAVYVDEESSDYPIYLRIDPRNAYPDIMNGQLVDLLTVEEINYRVAAQVWPEFGLDKDPNIKTKTIELVHYYSKDRCIQALMTHGSGTKGVTTSQAYVINEWDPKGVLPVAFAKLDSFDGDFRGNYDQVIGSLQTKNRIVRQVLDYTDQMVYSSYKAKGVLNPEAIDGPGTVYHLDPTVDGADMVRIPPASGAMQAIQLAQFLTSEQRGGTSYPESRQGEVSQSIASASFVASTMGSLTSDVRNIQRLIGKMREKLNEISGHYDEQFLDFEKPLIRPISKQITYTPSKALSGNYKSRCVYGASAGLDRMTADTRVLQQVSAQLVSKATGREQIDYVRDPIAEQAKIELEMSTNILAQKMLSDGDPQTILQLVAFQANGATFAEAAAMLVTQQQQQAPAPTPGAPAQPGQPAEPTTPGAEPIPATQGQAVAAGGAAPQPAFTPPPLENIMVGRSPAGATRPI